MSVEKEHREILALDQNHQIFTLENYITRLAKLEHVFRVKNRRFKVHLLRVQKVIRRTPLVRNECETSAEAEEEITGFCFPCQAQNC
jgi:hypothetical protein